jgi:tryptophanyl-tRNA synthetase
MSKSYGNAIFLADSPEEIRGKVARMITDPQRARRSDPGNPEVCNVFDFHQLYSPAETVAEIDQQCRSAGIGCVACKQIMAEALIKVLAPIREKRNFYEKNSDLVQDIMATGAEKARRVARKTMAEVREAIKI